MYSDEGLLKQKKYDKLPDKEMFLERTWSRGKLFLNVSHNTVDGTFKFPCTTVGGPQMGAPCAFPFVYPDCKEYLKLKASKQNMHLDSVSNNNSCFH